MANKIYINPETTITWLNTGGDELLDLGGADGDSGDVAVGSFHDLGSGVRSEWYDWELFIDGFATAPVVGETADLYLIQSNETTSFDGNPTTDPTTTVQGAATTDQLRNMTYVGSAVVYSITAGDELKVHGVVRLTQRYVSPVVHNNTADDFAISGDAHSFKLTPIPPEVQ